MKRLFFIITCMYSFFSSNSQCLKSGSGSSMGDNISKTSGNKQVDQQVEQLVDRLNSIFGTTSEFFFYDEEEGSNAFATNEDMNIYIGRKLVAESMNSGTGMTGLAFVLGHELAHIHQFQTMNSNRFMHEASVKNAELQADYLASYALTKLDLINYSNYDRMLLKAMSIGDIFFQQQDHHGTPSERKASAIWGYNHNEYNFDKAYEESYTYCCPKEEDLSRIVYTLNIYNGLKYYVLYGGGLYKKDSDGEFQKLAQMSSTGNLQVPFTFEFSRDDPSKNLFMDNHNQLLDYLGNVVGRAVKNDDSGTGSSNDEPIYKPRPRGSAGALSAIRSCNTEFCEVLLKVVEDYKNNFSSLLGEKTGETLYRANVRFPGQQSSTIFYSKPSFYVTFYRGDDYSASSRAYEDLKSKFEMMGISLDEKTRNTSTTEYRITNIFMGNGSAITLQWSYRPGESKTLTILSVQSEESAKLY